MQVLYHNIIHIFLLTEPNVTYNKIKYVPMQTYSVEDTIGSLEPMEGNET
jgi:hypothetical protein